MRSFDLGGPGRSESSKCVKVDWSKEYLANASQCPEAWINCREARCFAIRGPVEYEDLLERFRVEFQPETAVEEILIEQMAASIWRLRRVHRAERAEIQERLAYALLEFAKEESDRRSQASTGGYGGPLLTLHFLHFRNGRESNGNANTILLGMMIATR